MAVPNLKDKLTDLYLKEIFMEFLNKETVRSARYARPLSLLVANIQYDYFVKEVNLRVELGYRIIKELGRVLHEVGRDVDFCGRIDGEVVSWVMPETDREGAQVAAERLRKTMEQRTFMGIDHPDPRVALNIGLASFPENGTNPQQLLLSAESAAYEARAQGGNMVVAAEF